MAKRPFGIAPVEQKLESSVDARAVPLHLARERFKAPGSKQDAEALAREEAKLEEVGALQRALV